MISPKESLIDVPFEQTPLALIITPTQESMDASKKEEAFQEPVLHLAQAVLSSSEDFSNKSGIGFKNFFSIVSDSIFVKKIKMPKKNIILNALSNLSGSDSDSEIEKETNHFADDFESEVSNGPLEIEIEKSERD